MIVKRFEMGPICTNTYMLIDGDDVILIDPASKPEKCIELLIGYNLLAILLTHGHFDHIKAVDGLYEKYKCPVYMNELDEIMARDKESGADFGLVSYISCPIVNIKEGRKEIGPFSFNTIYTPGHTPGSVIYVFDDCVFTGDTLFAGSIGRTDLAGGDFRQLKNSLNVFKDLDENLIVYPGHEMQSTIFNEINNNPFLR